MTTPHSRGVTRRPLALLAIVLAIAASGNAALVGCGGKSTESETSSTATTNTPATTPSTTDTSSGGASLAGFDPATTFQQKCSTCHGPQGKGDGPAAAGLNPKPRNYHDQAYMSSVTDQQLHDSIFNGKSAMPAWGKTGVLTDAQVWEMVKFVRNLGKTS